MLSALLAYSLSTHVGQDVPKHVRYIKAPDAVNALAKAKLVKMISAKPQQADFDPLFDRVLIIGPGMWNEAKNAARHLKAGTDTTFMVPLQSGKIQQLKGRVAKTPAQLEEAGIILSLLTGAPKKPNVRKATAEELSYYWAIISYDITEPLFVVDSGKRSVLFDFDDDRKDPRLFFVDVPGRQSRK